MSTHPWISIYIYYIYIIYIYYIYIIYIIIGSSLVVTPSINRPNQVQSIQTKASPSNQRFHIASRLQHPFPSTSNRNYRTSAGCWPAMVAPRDSTAFCCIMAATKWRSCSWTGGNQITSLLKPRHTEDLRATGNIWEILGRVCQGEESDWGKWISTWMHVHVDFGNGLLIDWGRFPHCINYWLNPTETVV